MMKFSVRFPPMRSLFSSRLSVALVLFSASAAAPLPLAAQQGPAKQVNVFGDTGGFEKSTVQDNLWDGVDGDGNLAGFTFSAAVVTEKPHLRQAGHAALRGVRRSQRRRQARPRHRRPDRLLPLLSRTRHRRPHRSSPAPRLMPFFVSTTMYPREHDWRGNGGRRLDTFLSAFRAGGLAAHRSARFHDRQLSTARSSSCPTAAPPRQPVIPLAGQHRKRAHLQPTTRTVSGPTCSRPWRTTGTAAGKLDLITGEGTYSANAIHLLENIGTRRHAEVHRRHGKHTYIAYGDGREHLIPTVVDYNGDGNPDLIVADRSGEVGVYLNTGKPGGRNSSASSTITFGSTSKLPGLCSLYAADYNGDGLFDLIIGPAQRTHRRGAEHRHQDRAEVRPAAGHQGRGPAQARRARARRLAINAWNHERQRADVRQRRHQRQRPRLQPAGGLATA